MTIHGPAMPALEDDQRHIMVFCSHRCRLVFQTKMRADGRWWHPVYGRGAHNLCHNCGTPLDVD